MLADIIKIHCLSHRANFPMSRTSRTVVCKEGGDEHVLSDNFPYSGLWVYCCNCLTFIAWNTGRGDVSVKECPFCLSSLNPRLYACDHCAVTMLDFDDETLRKQHTVLAWGMPQPACPGCHRFPAATPQLHHCAALQCNLATARATCPFCQASVNGIAQDQSRAITAKLDLALAEAQSKAREAEERSRLAEESARKEIARRRQAESRAQEIEDRVTGALTGAQAPPSLSARAQLDAEAAYARAESEARARREAEQRAQRAALDREEIAREKAEAEARAREAEARAEQVEEQRRRAESAARQEAEMRAQAEQHAREIAERYTSRLAETQAEVVAAGRATRRDRVAIALVTGIAVSLFFALILLIVTLLQHLRY